MALPTIQGTLKVPPPAFVRKVRRRSDWGQPGDGQELRVKDAVEKLFRSQAEPELSVYLVECDDDLRRVALGLNAGRDSLKEAVAFVAFLPAEIRSLGIQCDHTPGNANLPCPHANSLHHDLVATDDQLMTLCESAMKAGREAGNCSPGAMKEAFAEAEKENCRTVSQTGNCQVAKCLPAGPP